ncbi:putative beta-1,4-xylosyltransferase IRX9H-like [Capsicum annuum]|nr:putative beta-1,4-xylosyltransferase IRX9H-like [Capsicum annuum]
MATESKSSVVKVKPSGSSSQVGSSSKPKIDSSVIKKKVVQISSNKQSGDSKGKSAINVSKTEREPLRLFYESLSKQIPSSEMAEFWLMEHGLLSPERSKKAFEKKQRKQKQIRTGTPVKSPPPRPIISKAESSKKQQQVSKNGDIRAKKRLKRDTSSDDDDDDDFILSPKRRKV